MRRPFCIVLFLLYQVLAAQSRPADKSMAHTIIQADTNEVLSLTQLAEEMLATDPVQSRRYAEEAETLSRQMDFSRGLALASRAIANVYEAEGDYAASLEQHFRALEIWKKLEDGKGMAAASHNIPVVYSKLLQVRESSRRLIWVLLIVLVLIIAALITSGLRLKRKELWSRKMRQQQEINSRSVITSEEKERLRIANELQESIGQQLSAAKLNISALHSFLKTSSDTDRLMIRNAMDLLDDSVKGMRKVMQSINPHLLAKSGLITALHDFTSKLSSASTTVTLDVVGYIGRFEPLREAVLFRILQEIIYNSLKHSLAQEIEVQLVSHERELNILIKDNGAGFNVEEVMKREQTLGLRSLQSRVNFLEGSIYFDSRPGKGTTVSIEIPHMALNYRAGELQADISS